MFHMKQLVAALAQVLYIWLGIGAVGLGACFAGCVYVDKEAIREFLAQGRQVAADGRISIRDPLELDITWGWSARLILRGLEGETQARVSGEPQAGVEPMVEAPAELTPP